MTNEELAVAIRDGQTELLPQLWESVRCFIKRRARRRLLNAPPHLRDLEEDLINQCCQPNDIKSAEDLCRATNRGSI
jgi:hypothetical protein